MEHSLLEADSLDCGYHRDQPVLRDVSLAVPIAATIVLVGPSGCGKTTLLKTVLGLVPPLGGRVTALGRSLPSQPPPGSVGFVPQGLGLVGNATVLRNVLMGTLSRNGRLRNAVGLFPNDQVELARDALERVGLSHKADHRPIHLSGGERRRVAIARALVQRPSMLVADEILSELDERTAADVLGTVRRLQLETGMGALTVEHDIDRACEVADVLYCLGRGTVQAVLEPGPDRLRLAREALLGHVPARAT